MRRATEVIDTWFDSGSMPWAQWHWPFENQAEFEAHFPADFICEGIDQTRGWFYSMLAIGATAFDTAPYRHVIVNELILDASGQKMSKSRGNVVDPWGLVERQGADAARLYLLLASQVWLPKRFDERQITDTVGGFLNTLRETYKFFALYVGDPGVPDNFESRPRVDRWILGRLDATTSAVRNAFADYDVTTGLRALVDFVEQLSNWYVRLNRARFWAADGKPDNNAVATLHECLTTIARLLAPGAPFVSDWLHRSLTGNSVHLASFPVDQGRLDPDLDTAMAAVRTLASLGRSARETANLRVRQPLATMRVAVPARVLGKGFDSLLPLLAAETNVREIKVVSSEADLVRLKGKPNFRTLGKVYGADVKLVAAATAQLSPAALQELEAGQDHTGSHDGRQFTWRPEDVVVEREVVTDWPVANQGQFVAALDPHISAELASEGLAREIVSRVQRLRKDAGYDVSTRITLAVNGDQAVIAAALEHQEWIAGETLAREVLVGTRLTAADRQEVFSLDEHAADLAVGRHGDGRTESGPVTTDAP
jgi:isoleucyl-tRNA synthetase